MDMHIRYCNSRSCSCSSCFVGKAKFEELGTVYLNNHLMKTKQIQIKFCLVIDQILLGNSIGEG